MILRVVDLLKIFLMTTSLVLVDMEDLIRDIHLRHQHLQLDMQSLHQNLQLELQNLHQNLQLDIQSLHIQIRSGLGIILIRTMMVTTLQTMMDITLIQTMMATCHIQTMMGIIPQMMMILISGIQFANISFNIVMKQQDIQMQFLKCVTCNHGSNRNYQCQEFQRQQDNN